MVRVLTEKLAGSRPRKSPCFSPSLKARKQPIAAQTVGQEDFLVIHSTVGPFFSIQTFNWLDVAPIREGKLLYSVYQFKC